MIPIYGCSTKSGGVRRRTARRRPAALDTAQGSPGDGAGGGYQFLLDAAAHLDSAT